eukprot:746218-Hanusia_phi.AAC.2
MDFSSQARRTDFLQGGCKKVAETGKNARSDPLWWREAEGDIVGKAERGEARKDQESCNKEEEGAGVRSMAEQEERMAEEAAAKELATTAMAWIQFVQGSRGGYESNSWVGGLWVKVRPCQTDGPGNENAQAVCGRKGEQEERGGGGRPSTEEQEERRGQVETRHETKGKMKSKNGVQKALQVGDQEYQTKRAYCWIAYRAIESCSRFSLPVTLRRSAMVQT